MSLTELTKAQVLKAIDAVPNADQALRRCREALAADPRNSYVVDSAPADILRKTLEIKYDIARERGKSFVGDIETLLALGDLGGDLITGVFTDHGTERFDVFFTDKPLRFIAAVIMES